VAVEREEFEWAHEIRVRLQELGLHLEETLIDNHGEKN
jgi:hypothetical protein